MPRQRFRRANVFWIPTEALDTDPARFQYKLIQFDRLGSTNSLKGVRKWDETLAGTLLCWEDPQDGKIYIVNGHNRFSKAVALGVKELKCELINAKDHVKARSIGALKNISEGNGTAIDCAKFIRDSGLSRQTIERKGILPDSKLTRDGIALSQLSVALFSRLIDDRLDPKLGVIIGDMVSIDRQDELMPILDNGIDSKALTEYCLLINSDHTAEHTVQQDLFGGIEILNNPLLDKARSIAAIRSRISKERRIFNAVAKNKDELSKGNNSIDSLSSKAIADRAKTALELFDRLKLQSGPLADLINDFSRNPDKAYDAIVSLLSNPSILLFNP